MTVVPEARERAHAVTRPWVVGEIAIIFLLVWVYDFIRSFAELREQTALVHARDIIGIEQALHLNIEQSVNRWLAGHESLAIMASYWYSFTHFAVTMTVLATCYVLRPAIYRGARNALLLTNCVGLVVYYALPVMPPRLLPHRDFLDVVALSGFGATQVGPIKEDQFAAMPSLHAAWALWVGVVVFIMVRKRVAKALALIYPMITTVVVIGTANHYVLDVIAGITVTLVAVFVGGLVTLRHGRLAVAERIPRSLPVPIALPFQRSSLAYAERSRPGYGAGSDHHRSAETRDRRPAQQQLPRRR